MHAALPLRLSFLQATWCSTLGCKGQEQTPCSQARTEWNAFWQGELAVLAAVLAANQTRAQAAEDAAANASLRNQQVYPLFHSAYRKAFSPLLLAQALSSNWGKICHKLVTCLLQRVLVLD